MAQWTADELRAQYERVKAAGWLECFGESARRSNFPVEFLLAIASRETGLQDVKGDYRGGEYHGFGVMQVDVGTDPEFCRHWAPGMVALSVEAGTEILAGKRRYLNMHRPGRWNWDDLAAAYNAGEGAVVRALNVGKDSDVVTTGGDYGADVVARKAQFAEFIAQTSEVGSDALPAA